MTILLSEDEWFAACKETLLRFIREVSLSFFDDFFGDNIKVFDVEKIIELSLPEFEKFLYRIYKIFVISDFFPLWKKIEMRDNIISQAFRYDDKSFFNHYAVLKKFGKCVLFDFDSCDIKNIDIVNAKYNAMLVNYLCSVFD